MTQTPDTTPNDDVTPVDETPLEETPAVAGGQDSGEPEQGTGTSDSH